MEWRCGSGQWRARNTWAQELFRRQGSTPSPHDIIGTCMQPQQLAKVVSTSSVSHACYEELGVHQKSKTLLLILSQAKQQSIVIVARSWQQPSSVIVVNEHNLQQQFQLLGYTKLGQGGLEYTSKQNHVCSTRSSVVQHSSNRSSSSSSSSGSSRSSNTSRISRHSTSTMSDKTNVQPLLLNKVCNHAKQK